MYSHILMAIDLDQPSSWARALPVGVELVRCFGSRLTLCTVVPDSKAELEAEWSTIGYREMIQLAEARLRNLAAEEKVEAAVRVALGSVSGGLIDTADRVEADLIIIASHKPKMKDYLLGANASRVVRTAHCSVLVVRGAEPAGAGAAA